FTGVVDLSGVPHGSMSVLARASPRPSPDPAGVKEIVEAIITPTAANTSRTRRTRRPSSLTPRLSPKANARLLLYPRSDSRIFAEWDHPTCSCCLRGADAATAGSGQVECAGGGPASAHECPVGTATGFWPRRLGSALRASSLIQSQAMTPPTAERAAATIIATWKAGGIAARA